MIASSVSNSQQANINAGNISDSQCTWQLILKDKQVLDDRCSELNERRASLEARLKACAELNGNVNAGENDRIKLNVGGVHIDTKRSTLTLFPNSKLGMMFNGRWDKQLLRDKHGRCLLDVPPICFKLILKYLQLYKASSDDSFSFPSPQFPVPRDLEATFNYLCTFFGISLSEMSCDSETNEMIMSKDCANTDDMAIGDTCNNLGMLLAHMECQLTQEEQSFSEEEAFVDSFCSGDTKDVVHLSVDGEGMIAVRRSTLRFVKDSALSSQFDDTTWCQGDSNSTFEHDEDSCVREDSVWVDQPGGAFVKLIDRLRLMVISSAEAEIPPLYISPQDRKAFEDVVQYYFPSQEQLFSPAFLTSSVILTDEKGPLCLKEWLQEDTAPKSVLELRLLYRGSQDGFAATHFHSKCDGVDGGTITLVKDTKGNVFGGYTNQPWSSSGSTYIASSCPFLFSIINPFGHDPVKLPVRSNNAGNATYLNASYGPTFGGGHDMHISDRCDVGENSYSSLGSTYCPPSGMSASFLTGAQNFQVVDIEVFSIHF